MEVDTGRWSGDGAFTQLVIDRLRASPLVGALRVEDAPASREEPGYLFISNELYVTSARVRPASGPAWWPFGRGRRSQTAGISAADLEEWLAGDGAIGRPDFSDGGMLQFLRTERIIAPYQTRGYKLIELVRVYTGNPFGR